MIEYMEEYTNKLTSQLLKSDNSETKGILSNLDITKAFRHALNSSYKAVKQKQNLPEGTNDSVKIIENKLHGLYEDVKQNIGSPEANFDDVISLATSYCNMGMVYTDFTSKNKLVVGRSHLKKCLELLSGKELDRRAILVFMRAVVLLEYVFCRLKEEDKCCSFSHKAIGFYLEYTRQGSNFPAPIVSHLSISLDVEEDGSNTMHSLVTLGSELLYHLQDCHRDSWDLETLVKPMHNFLMNQWIQASQNSLTESFAWAYAALDFSCYFIKHLRFSDTRNYLAVVQCILFACKEGTNDYLSLKYCSQSYSDMVACLTRRWSSYSNNLFFSSKWNLYSKNVKVRKAGKSKSMSSVMLPTKSLIFTEVEEYVKDIVSEIPVTVSNIHDATLLCNHNIKLFSMPIEHSCTRSLNYTLTKRTLCRIEICKYLPYFEADKNSQLSRFNSGIEFLMSIKNSIIPSRDEEFLNIVSRNCNFGLTLTYSNILDLILEDAEITEKEFGDIEEEVHNYVTSSVIYCEAYLEQLDVLFKACEKRH